MKQLFDYHVTFILFALNQRVANTNKIMESAKNFSTLKSKVNEAALCPLYVKKCVYSALERFNYLLIIYLFLKKAMIYTT